MAAGPDHRRLAPSHARLLRQLRRFGLLTRRQAAALTGVTSQYVGAARLALARRGWLRTRMVVAKPETLWVYALTERGLRAARRRFGAGAPAARAALGRVETTLAAADLAIALRGDGEWWTAAELDLWWRRGHAGERPPWWYTAHLGPEGALVAPDGRPTPVWIVLARPARPWVLRRLLEAAYRCREVHPPRLYALPALCGSLRALHRNTDVRPWTSPRLTGRAPLLPGWETPAPFGRSSLATLTFLDRFGYATASQIARAHGDCVRAMCQRLARMEALGLARRQGHSVRLRRPAAWSASETGLRAAGSRRHPLPARPQTRRHTLALVDLAHELASRTGGAWETERELDAQLGQRSGASVTPPPDGRLTLPDGTRVLIQLQLSRGRAAWQHRAAWRQRHRGLGDQVWFICTPELAPRYRRERKPAEEGFIHVVEWEPPNHEDRRPQPRTPLGPLPGA